jgi:hypothetical protein
MRGDGLGRWVAPLIFALLLTASSWAWPASNLTIPGPRFSKIVLVSYDGVSKRSLLESVQFGDSPNAAYLLQRGAITDLRLVGHKTSTDPGLAVIETGYGPATTGIEANYFGAGSEKRVIPDGLTIAERIKARYGGGWKTGLVLPWTLKKNNVTGNEDPIFWNALPDLDYVFSSSNLTWSVSDPVLQKNAFSFNGALLRANFTAMMASKFIEKYYKENFYLRTHWIEPDTVGHAANDHYPDGTMTAEYRRALREVDQALGIILQTLRAKGILEETLVLVTTDHGFAGGHGGEGYPFEDPLISVTWVISSHPEIKSPIGWGIMNDIAPTVLAAAGIDVSSLTPRFSETSGAMPLWSITENTRDTRPPEILRVTPSATSIEPDGEFTVSIAARDESGISQVRLYYLVEGIGFWRFVGAAREGEEFKASLKSFLPGRAVQWYIVIVDGSPARNWARYPSEGAVTLSVTSPPAGRVAATTPSADTYLLVYAILGLGIATAAILALRKRTRGSREV